MGNLFAAFIWRSEEGKLVWIANADSADAALQACVDDGLESEDTALVFKLEAVHQEE